MRRGLQEQRRLADSGIAPDEDHAALDESAAQHAVEFPDVRRDAREILRVYLRECDHLRRPAEAREAVGALHHAHLERRLDQRVPRVAVRTLALPLR
jgi:hypothetical protein